MISLRRFEGGSRGYPASVVRLLQASAESRSGSTYQSFPQSVQRRVEHSEGILRSLHLKQREIARDVKLNGFRASQSELISGELIVSLTLGFFSIHLRPIRWAFEVCYQCQ